MALSGWGASKLLLFGEHAAVYGYPAVGVALPDGVRLHLRPDGGSWRAPEVPEPYASVLLNLLDHAESVLSRRSAPDAVRRLRGEILVETTVPPGMGFGSSAAVCTALARAVLPQLAAASSVAEPTPLDIWQLAHELEVFFHGSPSGIDTGISNLGGIQAFTFERNGLPRAETLDNADLFLLVGAVPRRGDTKHLVTRVKAARQSGDPQTRRALAELGAIAERAISVLAGNDTSRSAKRLGTLAESAQEHLRRLELSTGSLEDVIAAGTEAGSVGGKLSGAGGGGAFYLLFEDAAALRRAEAAVRRLLDRIAEGLPLFSYRVVAGDAERVITAA
ncbi:MAG: mevalonate kinase [Spirochaetaceae bacterium]